MTNPLWRFGDLQNMDDLDIEETNWEYPIAYTHCR